MTTLDPFYAFRDEIVRRLERDLVGPGEPDETITDFPLERYVCGILYPQHDDPIDPSQDDDVAEGDDEATFADPPVALANEKYPASAGLTFAVDIREADEVCITPTAAMYSEQEVQEGTQWARRPVLLDKVVIAVDRPVRDRRILLAEGLELFVRVRPPDAAGAAAITVAVVNTRTAKPGKRDADSFFQVGMVVEAVNGRTAFVERDLNRPAKVDDADLRSYQLLYRDSRTFAVGHGCSVDWDAGNDPSAASRIWTTFVPCHALLLADSNPKIRSDVLSFRRLVDDPKDVLVRDLHALFDQYGSWVAGQHSRIASLPPQLRDVAEEHLTLCRDTLERIRDGVLVLDDPIAWEAFRLANRAMLLQRARASWLRAGKPSAEPALDGPHEWRPFQLAFILQSLRGIVDPRHPDRDVADLLWFPTGGGKTEAYLGLIAFTVFLRRLRRTPGDGVTVIMRYTLRLLTIQQFDRAALLIACCEQIRRQDERLGPSPISVGLWVGKGGSPNTLAEARAALDRLRNDLPVEDANPVQLHVCPWCGAQLGPFQYEIATDPPHLRVRCRDASCLFREGLPVVLVDEDIYRLRPTLIIATSDKFATIPWRQETGALFNRGSHSPPPELIVQDELHLISGPLGTLAGLYETAIDFLCTEDGRPPKIIASTATIRRAEHQTKGLFLRRMRQFPPPALDAGDSWFAVEAEPERKGTRLYAGVMAPGTSPATLMIRTYASLLQSAYTIESDDDTRDPYWTLVGYFNSLRVLGGARMQVQDDVTDRLHLIGAGHPRMLDPDLRIELTSRESSGEIPRHLKRMEVAHPDEAALDVILATNMISVGVDIDRLGLMVVMGQPQSTSEYIQSTSRVGRQYPGLVVTLFNAGRSRDRSHYERFKSYHSALYRQVESTSVTPFSPRARDRGLHAVLIALARLTIPGLTDNAAANAVSDYQDELNLLAEYIVGRVTAVDPEAADATADQLTRIIEQWRTRATAIADLRFNVPDPDKTLLVAAADEVDAQANTLPTLWSLRDVDQESNLFLTRS
jgi:Helicase conserved C-terminal domain